VQDYKDESGYECVQASKASNARHREDEQWSLRSTYLEALYRTNFQVVSEGLSPLGTGGHPVSSVCPRSPSVSWAAGSLLSRLMMTEQRGVG